MPNQFSVQIHADGVAEVVLDRPPVNALNSLGWFSLAAQITALGQDPDVRVIVIRAEGRGFCAGVDIKELDADRNLIIAVNAGNFATFKAVHLNPVPVIVAVHGFVLGGGIGICGAADIVIAAEDARFGLPEVDRGAMGGAAHLQRMFGVQKTRYLFFTGEMIEAAEALRLGAIERVVPRERLRDEAMAVAAKIAAKSPAMIRIAKEALTGIEDGNLEAKYRWEQGFTLQAYMSPDSAETRRAFVEKREAKF
ncbi:MAG TPA: enoyl-CoA hydratase family protein [Piscinibacter sp.]|nr:enoyl-CoA hydratase family protein [Thauera aminoaromatica]HNK17483.1 enoyl-CoA hydratase family protein [Piscinibacter sp.]